MRAKQHHLRLIAIAPLTVIAGCYVEPDLSAPIQPPAQPPTPASRPELQAQGYSPTEWEPAEWMKWYVQGYSFLAEKEYALAINAFDASLVHGKDFSLTYINRGFAYRNIGMYCEAIADLRKGIALEDVNGYMPHLYLAETLACCPDSDLRNGSEAIDFAQRGCAKSQWSDGPMLTVLAAAYAESGEFDDAIHWQSEACKYSSVDFADEMQRRLELYHKAEPCRSFLVIQAEKAHLPKSRPSHDRPARSAAD
jgi:tetratricopeptide (TPR) repeat protein